jgi:hypothetical protein
MQMLAQAIEQRGARIDPQIVLLAVNSKRYRNGVLRSGYFRRFGTPDSVGHLTSSVQRMSYHCCQWQAGFQKPEFIFAVTGWGTCHLFAPTAFCGFSALSRYSRFNSPS